MEMVEALPDVNLIEIENVLESAEAERVRENRINQRTQMILPQSFSYLESALNVAEKHPQVIFFAPGRIEIGWQSGRLLGNNFEAMCLTGIAGEITQNLSNQ